MIEIKKLSISFGKQTVLENIDLSFPRTGLFCVCGESGSGKSSLLNAISSIIPFSGSIKVDGVEINGLKDIESANYRLKNIGFIFQDFKLFNSQTVEQNITFPLSVLSNCSEKKKKIKCNDLLDIVGLSKFNKRICNSLSGGEKQRVAIARALINKPKIIIADEPTGSLDEKTGEEILKLLKSFSNNSLIIMVTHDIDLADRFADNIIFIKDKHIFKTQDIANNNFQSLYVLSNKECQKKRCSIPFSFAINHAKQNMKTKRIRSALSTLFMSLGLMGIGLSISFSNSISNDIKRSYNSLVETASISIRKPAQENTELKIVNYDDAKELVNSYKDQIPISCGVGYKANFEEMFKDCNEFYLESGNKICFLNELSIRNVNDFLAITKIKETIFPNQVSELNDDEIVLGLTIQQIRTACANFNIEKSVDSLSNYLEEHPVNVVIDLANQDWEYTDQQIFTLKGFTLCSEPYVAHSNRLFNKIVLEDNMRFPTTETYKINTYPWVLDKITYIETENNYEFIKLMRANGILDDYIFEVLNKKVFVTKFLNSNPDQIDCLVPYYCPSSRLSEKEIEYILSYDKHLNNPTIYNNQGYVNYPENLISGFANRTYFSLSEDELFETIENNSSIKFNANEKEILKKSVVFSDFSQSFSSPVKFDSDFSKLISGREPMDLDEIVISTGLMEKLNSGDYSNEYLYVSTATKEINEDIGVFTREYQTSKLKIVGLIDNEELFVYHDSHWTEDYFVLKNGQNVKNLLPSCISFSLEEDVDTDEVVRKLERAFPQYEIINPLLDINESIDSLCDSISLFVLCISAISLVISFILLCSCSYLHVQDIKTEIAMSRCIGINSKEASKFLYSYTFYSSCFALLISSIELTITNLAISYFSADILSLPFKFSISYFAYLSMAVGCIVIGFLSSRFTAKHIRKISPLDCLKI